MKFTKYDKGSIMGMQISEYSMRNEQLEVRFLNIGGALTKIAMVEDQFEENLILNYDQMDSFFNNGCYLNSLIGRTSNRIKNGQFSIEGQTYQLDLNNGPNNLHGGKQCLTYADFTVEQLTNGYKLSTLLPHQEQGFPGNLLVSVTYTLEGNQFKVSYEATTDQTTIVNLTQHAYFNLSGNLKDNIYQHELQIKASHVAAIDENLSFTTELIPVEGTLFDFNHATVINPESKKALPLFEIASGYDHLYLLSESQNVVTFKHVASNRTLTISTTSPAMQFYAGNFLTPDLTFENGRPGEQHLGACFETHLVPFDFDTQILKPNEVYRQQTTFTFTK